MSDNKKLEELIEEYGSHKYMQSQATALMNSGSLSARKGVRKSEVQAHKAKQAILDYVEGEKKEYYDKGYEKCVELWKRGME